MKARLNFALFTFSILTVSVLPASAQITRALTPAEVAAKRSQVDTTPREVVSETGEQKTESKKDKPSLLANSDFLIGPHGFSIIPKGSLVSEGKMVTLSATAPKNKKLLSWDVFSHKHRAGLRYISISESQWKGEASLEPLRPQLIQAGKRPFTTLTTLNGGLVSLPEIQKLLNPK